MPEDSSEPREWMLSEDELHRAYERGMEDQRELNIVGGYSPEWGTHEAGLRFVAAAVLRAVTDDLCKRIDLQSIATLYTDPEVK